MIKRGSLADYFDAVVAKRLSAVETRSDVSNQHEFNGIEGFKRIFGTQKATYSTLFVNVTDEADPEATSGFMTWYDARERDPRRSEFRFYFSSSFIPDNAAPGDLLLIGKRPDDTLLVLIAAAGSTSENQLLWLFDITELSGETYTLKEPGELQTSIGLAANFVLAAIGIDVPESDDSYLEVLLGTFGSEFPTTRKFSAFARSTVTNVSSKDDPDAAVVAWMEREELLFRTMERHIVAARLREGFGEDVDQFVSYSLGVQNRRKSRVGHALENHVEQIFRDSGVRYSRGARTENKAAPDFLFPGISEYFDPAFPVGRLTMLGVKSSCKDRWRQVLSEAAKIPHKHLLTLEPGISEGQTSEMAAHSLQLVVPEPLLPTFSVQQQGWLLRFSDLLALVHSRQA